MKNKLFENTGTNTFRLVKETDEPSIYIDRHGSMPDRPKSIRFTNPEDYNDHMGFDANLPDDVEVPPKQILKVRELMKQGYKVSGHAKWPENPRQIEIMMTLHTRTGSRYADVTPNGEVL
jgi:hypothetical protein